MSLHIFPLLFEGRLGSHVQRSRGGGSVNLLPSAVCAQTHQEDLKGKILELLMVACQIDDAVWDQLQVSSLTPLVHLDDLFSSQICEDLRAGAFQHSVASSCCLHSVRSTSSHPHLSINLETKQGK